VCKIAAEKELEKERGGNLNYTHGHEPRRSKRITPRHPRIDIADGFRYPWGTDEPRSTEKIITAPYTIHSLDRKMMGISRTKPTGREAETQKENAQKSCARTAHVNEK